MNYNSIYKPILRKIVAIYYDFRQGKDGKDSLLQILYKKINSFKDFRFSYVMTFRLP